MTALSHLQFAVCKLCAECSDAFCCDGVAFRLVLGHLVFQGDEADGGALLFLQAEELQDALVVVHVAIDENEQDLDRGDRRGQYLILDFRMSRLVGLGGDCNAHSYKLLHMVKRGSAPSCFQTVHLPDP